MHTPADILSALRAENPSRRFAANRAGTVVALWLDDSPTPGAGQWVPILALAADGTWVRVWGLPRINGAPAVPQSDYAEDVQTAS